MPIILSYMVVPVAVSLRQQAVRVPLVALLFIMAQAEADLLVARTLHRPTPAETLAGQARI
jgi:hypothetical protein